MFAVLSQLSGRGCAGTAHATTFGSRNKESRLKGQHLKFNTGRLGSPICLACLAERREPSKAVSLKLHSATTFGFTSQAKRHYNCRVRIPALHAAIVLACSALLPICALAGSATWNQNPTSNDWFTAANWTPETVPNGETDAASFGFSNVANPSVTNLVTVAQITFDPEASAYVIGGEFVEFDGAGVINNSGITQTIAFAFNFYGSGTAGDGVTYNVNAGALFSYFRDDSSAGASTFLMQGQRTTQEFPGELTFSDNSTAANSMIINQQSSFFGGATSFIDHSTAGNSTIVVETNGGLGFSDNAKAGTATISDNGGRLYFDDRATGEFARVSLTNGATLDVSRHDYRTVMPLGSLSGDSTTTVLLGSRGQLTIGGNGVSTTFSGVITSTSNGSLIKTGSELLTLTGANTYGGGTHITGGILIVQTRSGSATGSGSVKVDAGTLGGKGTISGAVTVGTGSGTGSYLAPGTNGADTLILSKTLAFNADSSYKCDLSLGQAKADQVKANGVTIQSGAQFVLQPKGFQTLTVGTVFTVIDNTAATPISGTFANLADGVIINGTSGNKLQASYSGGDGNDLTLTVVP